MHLGRVAAAALFLLLSTAACGTGGNGAPSTEETTATTTAADDARAEVKRACKLMDYDRDGEGTGVTAKYIGPQRLPDVLDEAATHARRAAQLEERWTDFAADIASWRNNSLSLRVTDLSTINNQCAIAAA